jgi:hypothetical protein
VVGETARPTSSFQEVESQGGEISISMPGGGSAGAGKGYQGTAVVRGHDESTSGIKQKDQAAVSLGRPWLRYGSASQWRTASGVKVDEHGRAEGLVASGGSDVVELGVVDLEEEEW